MGVITAVISSVALLSGAKNIFIEGVNSLTKEEKEPMDNVKGVVSIAVAGAFLYGAKIVIETLKTADD